MGVKIKDLKDQIGTTGPRSFLYCRRCGNESSGNAGDYWNAKPEYVFKCCNSNMLLVTKRPLYEVIV